MSGAINLWLLLGAVLSAVAAALHVAIIIGGARWYRYFGAGEQMAGMAEAGRWAPGLITAGLALVLSIWSAYALAGAGWLIAPGSLPWLKLGLSLITTAYLLRGLAVVPAWLWVPTQATPFMFWSSLICLGYGLVHLVGLVQVWGRL